MGKIRPAYIKRLARELVRRYPDVFTTDFETNKRLVEKYANVPSKKVRNRVAGYIVRLVKQRLRMEGITPQATQTRQESTNQQSQAQSTPSG
ncbi:MAG: 30S ribosomal protein S17e [Candidatus Baldrarchaeia archaeon]